MNIKDIKRNLTDTQKELLDKKGLCAICKGCNDRLSKVKKHVLKCSDFQFEEVKSNEGKGK